MNDIICDVTGNIERNRKNKMQNGMKKKVMWMYHYSKLNYPFLNNTKSQGPNLKSLRPRSLKQNTKGKLRIGKIDLTKKKGKIVKIPILAIRTSWPKNKESNKN